MTSWHEITTAAPDLAGRVEQRFAATGLGYIATLRRDGSPRISGVEPLFAMGELWLGMMHSSRKANDLLRDARFSLHAANVDKQVADGDARVSGRVVEVTDDGEMERFRAAFAAANGDHPPAGPFHLFRADITEVVFVRPEVDHLVIESHRPGGVVTRVDRY